MTEQDLFVTALRIEAPADRSAYLDRACAGDDQLRHRVEALLRAHALAGDFLGTPAVAAFGDPAGPPPDDTRTGPSVPDAGEPLDFLTPSDKPGSIGRLGHYEVQEAVGRGGMGVVLRAFDEQLHRVVAIKVMAAQLATNGTARRRFTREARAAAAVTHDHVVTIHAVEDAGPLPYIVMQFVAGSSLQDRLDRTGPLPLAEILRIGMQTATGLAAAHAQGLVHRDVKPANILLENGVERVKLTDFGLARAADDASLTRSGTVAGTPSFMSPEQAEGKAVDHRSDLFSLGSVLYAMCTGRPPFRASTSMGVLKRVCEETPKPIRETNPEVPDWLVAVVEMLHAKDPAARFQSAAEVADVLGQHLAHVQHPSVAPLPARVKSADAPPAPARPARRGRRWAVATAILAALFAVLGTTEVTGVTTFRAAILRVFAPDDAPVVETSGPAGKPEVRPAPPVANEEPGAFVLLGRDGVELRKFETLAEAVLSASDGATIEIRGNGPFVSDGVTIKHALVIRAGEGYTPSVTLSQASANQNRTLLSVSAPLVLEGLELRRIGGSASVEGRLPKLINAFGGGALHVVNCRLIIVATLVHLSGVLVSTDVAAITLRNCELIGKLGVYSAWDCVSGGRCTIENCVSAVGDIRFNHRDGDIKDVNVRVRGNTFAGNCMSLVLRSKPNLSELPGTAPPIHLEFSRNVTHRDPDNRKRGALYFLQAQLKEPYSAAEAEAVLPRLVGLDEKQNVYLSGMPVLVVAADWPPSTGRAARTSRIGTGSGRRRTPVRWKATSTFEAATSSRGRKPTPSGSPPRTSASARTAPATAPARTARTSVPTWIWSAPAQPTSGGRRCLRTRSG
jgi:hypothetical protein